MEPKQQLRVLSRIWGNDREGFVFLPWIPGTADTKEKRKKSWREGPGYQWPQDKPKILSHLTSHQEDDVYFTPALFNSPHRREEYAEPERTLWADLDASDPRKVPSGYRPTIAWESSPGRFQAVWLLNKPRVGASWAGKENQRLTTFLEADPSGYDTTQLLRVPGRVNMKPEYRKKSGERVEGKLLWDNGPRYTWDDFDELPEISTVDVQEMEMLDEDLLNSIDRHAVWAKVRLKVPQLIREYMAARSSDGADRSAVLWQIERELADAGCSLAEIVVLVRSTVWNKFAGRNNEIHMLKTEASKALAVSATSPIESLDEEKPGINWLSSVIAQGIPRPRWLIRNIWARGACGFIAGDPKSYKSWLGLDMAVSLAIGQGFLGQDQFSINGGPHSVLVIEEEDDLRLVVSRLQQIIEARMPSAYWHGQVKVVGSEVIWEPPDRELPIALHVATGFNASDETWQAWLDTTIAEGQFAMVIIDTLGTVAGDIDTDRAHEVMSKMLVPLRILSKKYDTAIAVIHHNKKDTTGSSRAGKGMLGSVALHAWVESALYVRKESPTRLVIESETKQAMGHLINVEIPHMGIAGDDRILWAPVVGPEASTEDASTPNASNSSGTTPPGARGRSQASQAGSRLGWMLSQSGGKTKGLTVAKLKERHGGSGFRGQLDSAIKNGFIRQEGELLFSTEKVNS